LSSNLLSTNLKINVLYGCKTWSLTLREENRLRIYENRVLRRIFGSNNEEVAGGWRRLQNWELHNLKASPNIMKVTKPKRMRGVGHAECMRDMRNAYKILVRKSKGKKPHRRPVSRWEDNIRMDLREIG
jgi:hypothetical protein